MKKHYCFTILTFISSLFASLITFSSTVFAQDCYYNPCEAGPFCDLGCQFYSPGDYVLDGKMEFYTADQKIIPHPYWEDYKDFTCRAEDCYDAPTDTWYCASDLLPDRPEDPAIRICTNKTFPHCDLTDINPTATGDIYCEVGAIRVDTLVGHEYCPDGRWICTDNGWVCTPDYPNDVPCWESPYPTCRCTGGTYDFLNSGTWDCDKSNWDLPEQGACEEMLEEMKIAFTPGYIQTSTPYLFQIHQNIIGKLQNIFSIFKLDFYRAPDWPGETTLTYRFTSPDGLGWAEAGDPSQGIHYGSDAHIYFRYLGGIHCEKEKLLQRLSPLLNFDQPYIFYDPRCDYEDPSEVEF